MIGREQITRSIIVFEPSAYPKCLEIYQLSIFITLITLLVPYDASSL